jgi:excinuclease ABC subunit A
MIELNLEYINLNRAIPTLSGGELQRLRFSKAINSQFSNFLYIFDEPSSGLHPNEWEDILNAIVKIKNKNNTIIIIEHNEVFKSIADKTFILGGDNGGEIIKNSKNITNDINFKYSFFESNKQASIKNETYNNIKNLSTSIQIENTLTVICGKSGSRKTSFLKWILPKYCNNPTYLDQSPLKGNNYSILSTYLGIFDEIKKMYADETKLDIDYFSFHHSSMGKCNSCNGTGLLKDEIDNTNTICPNCNGKRFSKLTLKYKVNDMNIYELLNLTINDLIQIIPKELKKTNKVLSFLQYINLGYLSLFREVSSLSGGEAQRIKICNIFFKYKRSRTFLLDEPFRGLDYNSKYKLVQFLYQIINEGNTIFIVEHDIIAIKNSSYIIEFGPKSGIHGGTILYNGKKDDIYNSEQSIIKQYL